jgi:phosphotriesterase-related protein
MLSRRKFIALCAGSLFIDWTRPGRIITVNGVINAYDLGKTLAHEHVLVDFIGADQYSENRWDKMEVINKVVPYFAEAKSFGVKTIVDCTPSFLGKDVRLLKMLADRTKMNIITNTGYYGAQKNKFLPQWAFSETAEQLAARWADDFDFGIEGTNVRPGFIKISVDARPDGLSDIHKKLVRAAALTHLKTGLTIYSHTGPANAAMEQIEILKNEKVDPSALVWVHAQAERNKEMHIRAAKMGTWVSLDGITSNFEDYADSLDKLKKAGLLDRVLISHDAGYYRPGEKDGGNFVGYTDIFKNLLPLLTSRGFTKKDIRQLLVRNPALALEFRVRKFKG